MRWLAVALLVVIVLLQHPLWLGKGGWLRVWDVDRQLQQQKETNQQLEMRNAGSMPKCVTSSRVTTRSRSVPVSNSAWSSRTRFLCRFPDKPASDKAAAPAAGNSASGARVPAKPARP
jgi:hypothetical protein